VNLLQHIPEIAGGVRTWIVTEGAQSIASEPADAAGAALWGAARVAREERPDLNLALVDVAGDDPSAMDMLVERILGQQAEDQLAIRANRCFGLRLRSGLAETAAPMRWRPDAAYLITGGFGEIGLIIADVMVKQGARRLILMGRTPLPQRSAWLSPDHPPRLRRRIDAIRALEAQGASVHLACVDVADERAVAQYLAEYAAEGWPSVKGVVHAAGVFANRLAGGMDRAAFQAVLEPKLGGAAILDRLLPELDLFVLFSSSGGYLPQPGQANYAAANAGLEAIAQQRRLSGRPAACLAWGVWDGAGLVADASGRTNVAEMERQGLLAMPPHRAAALFAHLCTIGSGTALIGRMDWHAFARARSGRNTALFEDVLQSDAAPAAQSEDLENLEPKDRRARIEQIVRTAVGQVLKIAPGKLAVDRTLGSMGMTSLFAMELRNRLATALNRPLSATLVWNHPTINALSEHLSDGKVNAAAPVQDETQSDAGLQAELAAVDSLSGEDAVRALMSSRSRGGRR
jgi:myxalamid-type polyketide synthase MxaE and MxaD